MAGMVGVVDSLDNTETEEDTETFKAVGKASEGDDTTTGQDAWKSNREDDAEVAELAMEYVLAEDGEREWMLGSESVKDPSDEAGYERLVEDVGDEDAGLIVATNWRRADGTPETV